MSPLRKRVHNLRRRLIAASVALFIALFGGITVQLASGHDPALASKTSSSSDAATTTTSTTTSQPQQQTSQPAQTTAVAPVTTSQS
jgi:hypothetical protein